MGNGKGRGAGRSCESDWEVASQEWEDLRAAGKERTATSDFGDVGTKPSTCLRHQEVTSPLGKTSSGKAAGTKPGTRPEVTTWPEHCQLVLEEAWPRRPLRGVRWREARHTDDRTLRPCAVLIGVHTAALCILLKCFRARVTDITRVAKSRATLRLVLGAWNRASVQRSVAPSPVVAWTHSRVAGPRPSLRGSLRRRGAAAARPLALCAALTRVCLWGCCSEPPSTFAAARDYVMVSSCPPRHMHPDMGILFAFYEGLLQGLHCFPCYT